ncbi:MAG TPA: elongation factor G [Longimicrobiales bacterium]|nr:elongation factor G [Longimicrobiales bacterium]
MSSARVYPTERIRNVVVLGHGGSGKTSLVEALCFVSGTARRHGSVKEGNTLTMHTAEELAHGISLQASPAYAEWKETKINLLDTPGYQDFAGEVLSATRVADGAVLVLGATTGVEVGTERVWEYCSNRAVPRLFFVSGMDREHADFEKVYEEIKTHLTEKVIPVEIPVGSGDGFHGIINLFSGRAHLYEPNTAGEYREEEVPEEYRPQLEKWRQELLESIATTDDTLLEHYLEGQEITREEAIAAMKAGMKRGELFPLFCGAPEKTWGTRALLSKLVELVPHPDEMPRQIAQRAGTGERLELACADGEPFAALVFKTATEPHVGELSYFRVFSGRVKNGEEVANPKHDIIEKLAHLSVPLGKERVEVEALHAGDIGVVAKLRDTHTNDTICAKAKPLILEGIDFPDPDISLAIHGASRSDEDKIGTGLHKLHEEDPTFHFAYDGELRQTIVRGLGELHLDVQLERLKRKFGVGVETEQPRIRYRETIRKTAEGQGRYKKQTGGRGQFGDCWIRLKPRPRGAGYEFTDAIAGGVIPNKFIPSVDKGVQQAAQKGIVAGFPMVDFECEVYDGSYHTVDSSDIAFQIAASIGFKKVAAEAGPVLLEPVMDVEVVTPEEYLGDVMGDLNQRRGRILGLDAEGRKTTIRALVPEAELYKYATTLRSLTQGRAAHHRKLHGYEEAPAAVAAKVAASADREEVEISA